VDKAREFLCPLFEGAAEIIKDEWVDILKADDKKTGGRES